MAPHRRDQVGPARAALVAALLGAVVLASAGCGGSSVDAKTASRAQSLSDPAGAGQGSGSDQTGSDPSVGGTGGGGGAVTPGGTGGGGGAVTPGGTGGGGGAVTPGGGGAGGGAAPPAGAKGADCTGFKNGPGMTNDTIRIGNSSDISGPVPGLFTQSQQATKAYVRYFNDSHATICGRSLVLDSYDSRTDGGGDLQGYSRGCANDFAMVGSMSAFDSGGAKTAQDCGLPDIRAIATTTERGACTTCYAAEAAGPDSFENAVPDYIIRKTGGQKAAMLYINIGASASNGQSQARLMTKRGMKFAVVKGIDVAEFNYGPYVTQLKSAGVTSVQFIAAPPQFARLAQAFVQASYHPKVFLLDPSAYADDYPKIAGSSAKGTVVFLNFPPFEEASRNAEETLYLRYLQQVAPGAKPGFFGLFAWSAARLFAEKATKLGGKLTRASLIASMKGVDNWTANGLHAPQHVGAKRAGDCWRFIQWSGSAWVPTDGATYQCRGLTYR